MSKQDDGGPQVKQRVRRRKRGRPPMARRDRVASTLVVRLKDADRRVIEDAAAASGMSLSEFVRYACTKTAGKEMLRARAVDGGGR